ncbi:MAG: hypothetical protein IKA63_03495, partial [Clostridia bacterium]|nr:hypothetical protein [Clostridia bacterium]
GTVVAAVVTAVVWGVFIVVVFKVESPSPSVVLVVDIVVVVSPEVVVVSAGGTEVLLQPIAAIMAIAIIPTRAHFIVLIVYHSK